MGIFALLDYLLKECFRVFERINAVEEFQRIDNRRKERIVTILLLCFMILLLELEKTGVGLLRAFCLSENLGRVGGVKITALTEDVFPRIEELVDKFAGNSLSLADCEAGCFRYYVRRYCCHIDILIVVVRIIAIVATYKLIENVEGGEGIPSPGCISEMSNDVGHRHIAILSVEIYLNLLFSRSQVGIGKFIFTVLHRATDSSFQFLVCVGNRRTLDEDCLAISLLEQPCQSHTATLRALAGCKCRVVYKVCADNHGATVKQFMELTVNDCLFLYVGTLAELIADPVVLL